MQLLRFPVLPGSAEEQVIWCDIVKCLLIAYFIGNTSAKKCQNPLTCVKVIASQMWNVFLRHSAEGYRCWYVWILDNLWTVLTERGLCLTRTAERNSKLEYLVMVSISTWVWEACYLLKKAVGWDYCVRYRRSCLCAGYSVYRWR